MNLQKRSTGTTVVGILLIIFGATLFLSNFDIIRDVRGIIFSWQTILVVIGIILLLNHKDSGTGLMLLMIGGIGLFAKLNHTSMRYIFNEYWPALLIVFGIYILFNKSRCQSSGHKNYFNKYESNLKSD
ncbi:MAG: DUF5668 domain-containing protein [Melioribacteraceae bacterium]